MTKPTKLHLTKSAIDFAHKTLATADGIEMDKSMASHFESEKFDPKDYPYWKQEAVGYRQRFQSLAQQNAPSVPRTPTAVVKQQPAK